MSTHHEAQSIVDAELNAGDVPPACDHCNDTQVIDGEACGWCVDVAYTAKAAPSLNKHDAFGRVRDALGLAIRNDESRLYMLPCDDSGDTDRLSLKTSIQIFNDALVTLDRLQHNPNVPISAEAAQFFNDARTAFQASFQASDAPANDRSDWTPYPATANPDA